MNTNTHIDETLSAEPAPVDEPEPAQRPPVELAPSPDARPSI